MQRLVQGVHKFQSQVFKTQQDLFERLTKEGQSPETLFITCADSRINPNLITQTQPGELFIIRNAGNIVPPYNPELSSGEQATIEYAVNVLNVKDIIVCGHSLCGAMSAMLKPDNLKGLPSISAWLNYAEPTRKIIAENYSHLQGEAQLVATIEENVLNQLENLCTHPAVAGKLARRALNLHAWVYKIETGEVFTYDPQAEQFISLHEAYPHLEARNAEKKAETVVHT